jgi:hypothetical protein
MAQVLIYSKWWDWSSDDAWGIRFLVPGVMLMCIPLITVLNRLRVVLPVVVAGVAIQLLAVPVGGLEFVLLLRSSHARREALYVGGANRVDFEDMRFDPNYSQIAGNWILLRELLHVPPGGPGDDPGKVATPLYDAIPAQDWAAAAHWDFIWMQPLSHRREQGRFSGAPTP